MDFGSEDPYKPKYVQLFEKLRKDIIDGRIKRGEMLPSEHELMRVYQVSSTTVRKSIDLLRNRGLIKRIQGLGTFVSDRPVPRSLEKVLGFSKNMQQIGLKPSTTVLENDMARADIKVSKALNLSKHERVALLRRLRFGDRTPMMLETRYINLRLCPDIARHDLACSLYEIYHLHYGIDLSRASQHLKIIFLKEREARLFGLAPGAPAFLVTGVTYSDKDEPVEYEESIYRGDEYEFFVEVGNHMRFGGHN